jgi:hypothetical protein
MERMGEKAGQVHGDCKFPKLLETDLLHEMNIYGFQLVNKQIGEKMSHLVILYLYCSDSCQVVHAHVCFFLLNCST